MLVLSGYLISHYDVRKRFRVIIYILAVLGLVTHIVGTYMLSVREGEIVSTYKGYYNLPCLLYSMGVFTLVKYASGRINKKVVAVCSTLSKYTFGVYLVHIFILRGFEKLLYIDTTNILYRLLMPFFVFSLAVVVSWIIKKIPFVKNVIP